MKTKRNMAWEIFDLMLNDSELDKQRAEHLIRNNLNDEERQEVRATAQRLDKLIEDVCQPGLCWRR